MKTSELSNQKSTIWNALKKKKGTTGVQIEKVVKTQNTSQTPTHDVNKNRKKHSACQFTEKYLKSGETL